MKVDFANVMAGIVTAFGDREAVVNVERGRRYSLAQYHALTNRIANMLAGPLGIGHDDRYFCILENDNLSLLSFPTLFKAHGCAVWTNIRDSMEEHLRQIEHVQPRVVFLESRLLETYLAALERSEMIVVVMDDIPDWANEHRAVRGFWQLLEQVGDYNPGIIRDDREDIALMRFTGGTTGAGKCAMYTMDNWFACRDSCYAIPDDLFEPGTRFLHLAPISHGSGLMVLPTLFRGGCMITMNDPDLSRWCEIVEQERVTGAFLVPTLTYRLLELQSAKNADLSSLRTLIYAASPMSPAKLKLLHARFGPIFIQVYGATEHVGMATVLTKADHVIAPDGDEGRLASAGKPVPGIDLLICKDNGEQVEAGEIGEIWLRSRSTCAGYFRNPEQTEAEFQDGYWKSGDVGYQSEDGYLHLVDRKKSVIISGGFNIYANEVEAILNSHPDVVMSAVVGLPHSDWGEAVHAEVVLREGCEQDARALQDLVRGRLGAHKAPKSVAFVNALPMSSAGKVVHREIREKYWAGRTRKIA